MPTAFYRGEYAVKFPRMGSAATSLKPINQPNPGNSMGRLWVSVKAHGVCSFKGQRKSVTSFRAGDTYRNHDAVPERTFAHAHYRLRDDSENRRLEAKKYGRDPSH